MWAGKSGDGPPPKKRGKVYNLQDVMPGPEREKRRAFERRSAEPEGKNTAQIWPHVKIDHTPRLEKKKKVNQEILKSYTGNQGGRGGKQINHPGRNIALP